MLLGPDENDFEHRGGGNRNQEEDVKSRSLMRQSLSCSWPSKYAEVRSFDDNGLARPSFLFAVTLVQIILVLQRIVSCCYPSCDTL